MAREFLAEEYERYVGEGPYPTYANLARMGFGSFTLCSIRAVERGIAVGASLADDLYASLEELVLSLSASDEDGLTEFADPMTRARRALARARGGA